MRSQATCAHPVTWSTAALARPTPAPGAAHRAARRRSTAASEGACASSCPRGRTAAAMHGRVPTHGRRFLPAACARRLREPVSIARRGAASAGGHPLPWCGAPRPRAAVVGVGA
eukprot:scaffold1317_cov348-Prasinococcus_capsulatus_cf.AAC.4